MLEQRLSCSPWRDISGIGLSRKTAASGQNPYWRSERRNSSREKLLRDDHSSTALQLLMSLSDRGSERTQAWSTEA